MSKKQNCQTCGAHLSHLRQDAIYCSRKCRNRTGNLKTREKVSQTKIIDETLHKNRQILNFVLGSKEEIVVSKDYLLGSGFNLSYFTHCKKENNNIPITCCYEFQIVNESNNQLKIIR